MTVLDVLVALFKLLLWHRELILLPTVATLIGFLIIERMTVTAWWVQCLVSIPTLIIMFALWYAGLTAIMAAMDIGSLGDVNTMLALMGVAGQIAVCTLFIVWLHGSPERWPVRA